MAGRPDVVDPAASVNAYVPAESVNACRKLPDVFERTTPAAT